MSMFLNVLTGLLLFFLGQIIIRYFLDPLTNYRRLVGEIGHVLFYYANIYMNPSSDRSNEIGAKVEDALREKAGLLFAVTYAIPLYSFLEWVRLVPPKDSVRKAWQELTFLSNSVYSGKPKENREARKKIIDALKIPDWREN